MKTILALLSCLLLSNCGLISIPHKVYLPSEQFRSVKVLDANARKNIEQYSVIYEIYKDVNWIRLNSQDCMIQSLNPDISDNGIAQFSTTQKTDKTQIMFPLGLPLGSSLIHYHFGVLKVSAPKYHSIEIDDPESSDYEAMKKQRSYYRQKNGVLEVLLHKK